MQLERSASEPTLDQIELLIRALSMSARSHSFPQRYRMSKVRLLARRREILGIGDPEVLAETARTLDIENGGILVHDQSIAFAKLIERPWIDGIRAGEMFAFGLGGDGAIKVRLRVLAGRYCEPMATESGRLREATPSVRFGVHSGSVIADGAAGIKSQ